MLALSTATSFTSYPKLQRLPISELPILRAPSVVENGAVKWIKFGSKSSFRKRTGASTRPYNAGLVDVLPSGRSRFFRIRQDILLRAIIGS
jgi:hypothetical protein